MVSLISNGQVTCTKKKLWKIMVKWNRNKHFNIQSPHPPNIKNCTTKCKPKLESKHLLKSKLHCLLHKPDCLVTMKDSD